MKTPLDLIKTYFTFQSYFAWILMTSSVFSIFLFFKNKFANNQPTQHTTTRKGYLIYFLIIIGILGFIYLCFFHKSEPSSKYAGQLVNEIDKAIDKAIDKYDEVINNYQGLKENWHQEFTKVEAELKQLYEAQTTTQEAKVKIKEALDKNETKIKEIKDQIKNVSGNITILNGRLKQKEETLASKEKEIKLTQKQIEEATNLTEKQKLRAKLDILYDEKIELVKQINEIKSQIGLLENDIEMFNNMLSNANKLKNSLQRDYNKLNLEEQKLFTRIQTVERHCDEIQNNINKIEEKQKLIQAERGSLQIMYTAALAAKSAADNYNLKNKLNISATESFIGNVIGEVLQFKKMVYVWEEVKTLTNQLFGKETKEQAQERKQKEYDELLAQQLGTMRMLFLNPDGTMKMIDQSTFDSIKHYIDKETTKLDADYKDQAKKLEEYNERIKESNLENEIQTDKNQLTKFKQQDRSIIDEYDTITNELKNKIKRLNNEVKQEETKILAIEQLEIKLEPINEEMETIKEELKQLNPNYTKHQTRIKQNIYNKFLQPIIN